MTSASPWRHLLGSSWLGCDDVSSLLCVQSCACLTTGAKCVCVCLCMCSSGIASGDSAHPFCGLLCTISSTSFSFGRLHRTCCSLVAEPVVFSAAFPVPVPPALPCPAASIATPVSAGKSTLLRLIMGKEQPLRGSVSSSCWLGSHSQAAAMVTGRTAALQSCSALIDSLPVLQLLHSRNTQCACGPAQCYNAGTVSFSGYSV